jgi:hypothetical protein
VSKVSKGTFTLYFDWVILYIIFILLLLYDYYYYLLLFQKVKRK